MIGMSIVTGIPELDMLIPVVTIFLLPVFILFSDPILSILSMLPWVVAGFLTGYQFGPNHENAIIYSFPYLLLSISGIGLFSMVTIIGIGSLLFPSTELLFFAIIIVFGIIWMAGMIGILSLFFIVPSFIGYYFGRNVAPRVYPLMFYAQPNRIDPEHKRCRFLTDQNNCGVSKRAFIPNTCVNRFNQVTCPFYLRRVKPVNNKNPLGGLLFEDTN